MGRWGSWSSWRGLRPRQRLLAAVLITLVIAAGIYRWAHFASVNRLHGGSTVQTVTGEGELVNQPPTTTDVERGARAWARREGKLSHVSCHEVPGNAWSCLLHFVGGLSVLYRAVWYQGQDTIGWSVVKRTATVHFKVPVGRHSPQTARQREAYETGYIEEAHSLLP
jgi:hypothetical protein